MIEQSGAEKLGPSDAYLQLEIHLELKHGTSEVQR